jgi:hypothetical protein
MSQCQPEMILFKLSLGLFVELTIGTRSLAVAESSAESVLRQELRLHWQWHKENRRLGEAPEKKNAQLEEDTKEGRKVRDLVRENDEATQLKKCMQRLGDLAKQTFSRTCEGKR